MLSKILKWGLVAKVVAWWRNRHGQPPARP